MKNAVQILGMVTAAGALVFAGWFGFNRARYLRNHYRLIAVFPQANGLKQGDEVNFLGLRIGQVASIETSPENEIYVSVDIRRGVRIPTGSGLELQNINILGVKHIAISPTKNESFYIQGDTIRNTIVDTIPNLQEVRKLADALVGLGSVALMIEINAELDTVASLLREMLDSTDENRSTGKGKTQ